MGDHSSTPDSRPSADRAANTPHDVSTLAIAGMPLPTIRGYEIVRELKRGGMGIVYQARKAGEGEPVAVKMMLRGACADRGELERFHREARNVTRLDHANIVRVLDFGEQDGIPFFVMELVEE